MCNVSWPLTDQKPVGLFAAACARKYVCCLRTCLRFVKKSLLVSCHDCYLLLIIVLGLVLVLVHVRSCVLVGFDDHDHKRSYEVLRSTCLYSRGSSESYLSKSVVIFIGVASGPTAAGELREANKPAALPRQAARRRTAVGVVAVPGLRAGPGIKPVTKATQSKAKRNKNEFLLISY